MPYNYNMPNYQNYYQPYQQVQPSNLVFVPVQNEEAARNYPVRPGESITFIDENAPYCYTKSMDFSQFSRPKFEKYKLTKEDAENALEAPKTRQEEKDIDLSIYATNDDLEALKEEIKALRESVESISITKKAPARRREIEE